MPSLNPTDIPIIGGIYRHKKGNLYIVEGIVRHSEDLSYLVLYRQCYGDYHLWVRPLTMFCEMTTDKDGNEVQRFTYVGTTAHDPLSTT